MEEEEAGMEPGPVEASKERSWREVARIDAALAAGEIDEQGWHQAMAAMVRPRYLAAATPWEQSGYSRPEGEAAWVAARRFVVDALDRDGTFLDCGCANGYLMECVRRWAAAKGLDVEPYGVEVVPELVDLARRRLPAWADRIWAGNIATWTPPRRFEVVRTGLDYVPDRRRRELVERLLTEFLVPGGRLVVGPFTEEVERPATQAALAAWGRPVAGRSEAPHPDPRVVRRVLWLDV
jgi:hypothetical protein